MLLNTFSSVCYNTKHACITYWKRMNDFWSTVIQSISLSDFGNTILACHLQLYSCSALVLLINLWWREGDLCNQKTTSEWVWPWWKLCNLGKKLVKTASPQLGNISNLKFKGSLLNPNHILDGCAHDLSIIAIKFLSISSAGKEKKLRQFFFIRRIFMKAFSWLLRSKISKTWPLPQQTNHLLRVKGKGKLGLKKHLRWECEEPCAEWLLCHIVEKYGQRISRDVFTYAVLGFLN